MKVLREYPKHHYFEEVTKSELYCPSCGKQELWVQSGEGDYYQGVPYYCLACERTHHLDNSEIPFTPEDKQIVEQIRSGITAAPVTPPGQ